MIEHVGETLALLTVIVVAYGLFEALLHGR